MHSNQPINQDHNEEASALLQLCLQLEQAEASIASERMRAELMRRIARCVRRLPTGSWVGSLAVHVLVGEFFVKLSTNWGPAKEALLHISSEISIEEAAAAPRRGGAKAS